MGDRNYEDLEKTVLECGGEYGLNHSKRLLEIINVISEGQSYNKNIIIFCAYTHDLGGYPKYIVKNVDHAIRSREVVDQFIDQLDFSGEEKEIIFETILNHHSSEPPGSFEAILLRDADAIDFLGFMGIARDITRAPNDIKKGIQAIQNHRDKLPEILVLDSSKRLAEERINEMDLFLNRFSFESFGYY